jgi:hypothetical protein
MPSTTSKAPDAVVTYLKDFGWLILLLLFLPVWMGLGLAAFAIAAGKQLYLWARGNTTPLSRVGGA